MSLVFSLLNRLDNFFVVAFKLTLGFLSLAVAALLFLAIFTRSVLEQPMFGLEELTLVSVMWLYMIGATMASHERSHLAADFIPAISSNQTLIHISKVLSSLISAVVAGFFVSWSYDLFSFGLEKGQSTQVFNIPWYVSQGSMLVAAVFMCIYALRDLVSDLRSLIKSK